MPQRLVRHNRSEIGTADSYIDDVPDSLARIALPSAAAHPFTKIRHPVEDGANLWHDVLAVDDDRCTGRRAQGGVQDCAVFSDIDLASREHGRDPLLEARVFRKLEQEPQRLIGNPILRVIEIDPHRGSGQAFAASRVVREQLTQMQLPNLL